jgi:hypothetical protein
MLPSVFAIAGDGTQRMGYAAGGGGAPWQHRGNTRPARCVRYVRDTAQSGQTGRRRTDLRACTRLRALWGDFPVVVRVHSGAWIVAGKSMVLASTVGGACSTSAVRGNGVATSALRRYACLSACRYGPSAWPTGQSIGQARTPTLGPGRSGPRTNNCLAGVIAVLCQSPGDLAAHRP